ncbi:MFS transporter, partial [Candidatus Bathyarchaeota archaeon]|nr:MFS transporter [Candidatus Bathyarchaeota archaeon]
MGEEHNGRFLGMGRNALVLSVTESVGQGILFLVSPFWALFVLDIGASLPVLGLLGFILGLTRIALQPPVGYLTDRIGRKRLVVWGGFVASFAPFIYFFATRWEHLIPGVVLEAFTNIVLPARQAMFADSVEPERRATAFATIHTLFAVFSMTMPVLGGF